MLLDPQTDKYSMSLEDDKVRVGATSMQGWRNSMEDAHYVRLDLPTLKDESDEGALFAVFDGHCGSKVANTASTHIAQWVTHNDEFRKRHFPEALKKGFLKGDSFIKSELPGEESGCTANVLLLYKGVLYCANAGDTRAVLSRGGQCTELSEDHKPTKKSEIERIIRAGGYVCPQGRVFGCLALSRALGDINFKLNEDLPAEDQAVSALPDVTETHLNEDDEFFVCACDGVWDVLTSDEAVDFVREQLDSHNDVLLAAEKLLDRCLANDPRRVGSDNMTVIVCQFKSDYLRKFGDASPLLA